MVSAHQAFQVGMLISNWTLDIYPSTWQVLKVDHASISFQSQQLNSYQYFK